MNLDQAFRSAAAGLIYVFQGLHHWHRGLRSSNHVLRPLFEMKVSKLEQQGATEMGRSSKPIVFLFVVSEQFRLCDIHSRQEVALTARSHFLHAFATHALSVAQHLDSLKPLAANQPRILRCGICPYMTLVVRIFDVIYPCNDTRLPTLPGANHQHGSDAKEAPLVSNLDSLRWHLLRIL